MYKIIIICFMACSSLLAGDFVKEIRVNYASSPPVIDGILEDKCWAKEKKLSDFRKLNAADILAFPQTTVQLLHDKKNLYIGLKVKNPLIKNIPEEKHPQEDEKQAFKYDCVEFYFSESKTQYAFFVVNAQGFKGEALFPGYDADNFSWNCEWQARVKRFDNFWTAEIVIPFESLEFELKTKEAVLWTNFARTFAQGRVDSKKYSVHSSLNPEYGGFHALGIKLIMQ